MKIQVVVLLAGEDGGSKALQSNGYRATLLHSVTTQKTAACT